eukprot:scaffold1351_cov359-Prasinococcus_capsulatus_cf.AAC.8
MGRSAAVQERRRSASTGRRTPQLQAPPPTGPGPLRVERSCTQSRAQCAARPPPAASRGRCARGKRDKCGAVGRRDMVCGGPGWVA